MLEKNLFVFGLTTGPATHWGSHRYEDKAHSMRSSLHAVIRVHRQLETQFKNNSNAPFIAETKRKYTESFNDNLEQKSLTAADAVEAGDVSESEEDQEDKEIPVEMRTIDVTAEQKAKHAQRLLMKRGRGEDKIVKSKILSAKNSVDAVLRLIPTHQRTAKATPAPPSLAFTHQSGNSTEPSVAIGLQQEDEDVSSEPSSDSEEEGHQYLSQRQREAERMKAHIKRLNKQGL